MPVRQGVRIGIPRYNFDPKAGDQFFIDGKSITIKRKSDDFVTFSRSVNGTTGMSVSNLYQVAMVPENSRFAPYGYRSNPRPTDLHPAKISVNPRTGKVKVFVTPSVAAKMKGKRK